MKSSVALQAGTVSMSTRLQQLLHLQQLSSQQTSDSRTCKQRKIHCSNVKNCAKKNPLVSQCLYSALGDHQPFPAFWPQTQCVSSPCHTAMKSRSGRDLITRTLSIHGRLVDMDSMLINYDNLTQMAFSVVLLVCSCALGWVSAWNSDNNLSSKAVVWVKE